MDRLSVAYISCPDGQMLVRRRIYPKQFVPYQPADEAGGLTGSVPWLGDG